MKFYYKLAISILLSSHSIMTSAQILTPNNPPYDDLTGPDYMPVLGPVFVEDAVYKRADDEFRRGDLSDAERDYRTEIFQNRPDGITLSQVLIAQPGYAIVAESLAEVLTDEGNITDAIKTYEAIYYPDYRIKVGGGSYSDGLLKFAMLLSQVGRWPDAVEAFNHSGMSDFSGPVSDVPKAIPLFDPSDPQPLKLQVTAYICLGRSMNARYIHYMALDYYKKAYDLSPDSPVAEFYYGYGLLRMKRFTEGAQIMAQVSAAGDPDIKPFADRWQPKIQDAIKKQAVQTGSVMMILK